MKCELSDLNNHKTYSGVLTNHLLELRKPVYIQLDSKRHFKIVDIQRVLQIGNRVYLVDANGLKYKLTILL